MLINICEFCQNDFILKVKKPKKSKNREFPLKLRFSMFRLFSTVFEYFLKIFAELRSVKVDEPSMTVGIDLLIITKERCVCSK